MRKLRSRLSINLLVLVLFTTPLLAQEQVVSEGIQLFKSQKHKEAISKLKRLNENEKDAYLGYYYLGLAYLNQKKKSKAKKSFKKSVKLNDEFAGARTGLALSYMNEGKFSSAIKHAKLANSLNPTEYLNSYILTVSYRYKMKFQLARESVNKLIELKPTMSEAYLLKLNLGLPESRADKKSREYKLRLRERNATIVKYLETILKEPNKKLSEEKRNSMKFFLKHYRSVNNYKKASPKSTETTPIKIKSKPQPGFTGRALDAGVTGIVQVMAVFGKDGKIKHTLVIRGLGFGLDERAVKAAKRIKFVPPSRDGKPYGVVKMIQFNFGTR